MVFANSRLHSLVCICIILENCQLIIGLHTRQQRMNLYRPMSSRRRSLSLRNQDHVQSSDVAAMQSRRVGFICVERGSDFIPLRCKLREWVWHFGTLSWNGS